MSDYTKTSNSLRTRVKGWLFARRNSLLGGMMIWIPIAMLLAAIALWRITPCIETILLRLTCAVACLVAIRAAYSARYFWATAVGGIAVFFNPMVPDMVSRIIFFALYFMGAATVLLCLAALKIEPLVPTLALLVQRRVAFACKVSAGPGIRPTGLPPLIEPTPVWLQPV